MSEPTKIALKHFRETVKLLCGFLTAITLTTAIAEFAKLQKSSPSGEVTLLQWTSFLFIMWLMCRFFFGNLVHLNSDSDNDGLELVIDGVTILFESLLLAYMSHFITDAKRLFVFVCVLLFCDLVWWLISAALAKLRKRKLDIDRRISVSQIASMATVALFLFWGSDIGLSWHAFWSFGYQLDVHATVWIAIGNTVVDFLVNGPRYFGLVWVPPHLQAKVTP